MVYIFYDALMRTDYQLFYPGTLGPLHISTTSGNASTPSWNPSFYSSLYQATTLHLHHGMQSFTSLEVDRLSEQNGSSSQVDLKSSSSSMAGSDDSLDKSDLDENTESQDHYKSFQNPPMILELGQKIGSDRSAFVRHNTSGSSGSVENRQSPPPVNNQKQKVVAPRTTETGNEQSTMAKEATVDERPAPAPRKRNPYSIEELLKKDEDKVVSKRPKLTNIGVVQPCGIILNKEI